MEILLQGVESRIQDSFARQGLMKTFGARIIALSPGSCTIVAPILPIATQQHGVGHAGLAFSLGDSAAGYAAMTLMEPDQEVMTAEIKINLLSPAQGDRLVAVGEVARAGRRLSVVRADVFAETGATRKLIAILQGTMVPIAANG
jgi:uncharacterized protein (TIGR00369 family)